ncbi:MAG: hypothetical protein O7G87_12950 [bacterium]|nr:hypothetical protein [bacterium]
MRTRKAIEQRLNTLTQAYQLSYAHQNELSKEGRYKLRILEENMHLLKWCLDKPDPQEISWLAVQDAFKTGMTLFKARLFGSPQSAEPASDTSQPREAIQ